VRASKLSAKVDNTAIQDGYQLYLHNFIVSDKGNWTVVQQGMHNDNGTARRYHWQAAHMKSFIDNPHTGIEGISQGKILNLTDTKARSNRKGILAISHEEPTKILREFTHLVMPNRHDIRSVDVDLKRLGALLYVTRELQPTNFED